MTNYFWVNIGSGNGCCLRHQTITWTNVNLSSVIYSEINRKLISQKIPQPAITKIILKITNLNVMQIVRRLMGWIYI